MSVYGGLTSQVDVVLLRVCEAALARLGACGCGMHLVAGASTSYFEEGGIEVFLSFHHFLRFSCVCMFM